MSDKRFKRTENGEAVTVTAEAALAEINHAQMGGKNQVRTMSAGGGRYDITYKDGRRVLLVEEVEYPAVRVTDAPGYEDFDGELILHDTPPANMSVIGYVWDGKREVAVVPARCVTLLDEEV